MQVDFKGKKLWLNFHHLYYFYTIVNEGSLTKASEVLLIGPPSLSSQIKQLETNLEVELFIRKNKKLILTPKGQTLYEHAERIFKHGNELIETLHTSASPQRTIVRVGIPESISKSMILHLCRNVINDPAHLINIRSGKTSELYKDLRDRNLDLLFVNNPPDGTDSTNYNMRKIASSPLVICGHRKFKDLSVNFPQSLTGSPFMLSLPESRIRQSMDSYLKKNNIKIELIGETKDSSMQRIIATEGLGLIVSSAAAIQDLLENEELFEIGRPENLSEDLFLLSSPTWAGKPIAKKVLSDLQFETL